jgi:hypothetical protein
MRGLYFVYTPSFYESAVALFATCSWLGLISVGYKIYTRDLIEQTTQRAKRRLFNVESTSEIISQTLDRR